MRSEHDDGDAGWNARKNDGERNEKNGGDVICWNWIFSGLLQHWNTVYPIQQELPDSESIHLNYRMQIWNPDAENHSGDQVPSEPLPLILKFQDYQAGSFPAQSTRSSVAGSQCSVCLYCLP